jgi:hypothetical protein
MVAAGLKTWAQMLSPLSLRRLLIVNPQRVSDDGNSLLRYVQREQAKQADRCEHEYNPHEKPEMAHVLHDRIPHL